MADWTNIPNASIEPDAPARSIDALAFRDNPIAIAEGAAGAPRIPQITASDTVTNHFNNWNDVPPGEFRTLFDGAGAFLVCGGSAGASNIGTSGGLRITVDGSVFSFGEINNRGGSTSIPPCRSSNSLKVEIQNPAGITLNISGVIFLVSI